MKRIITFLLTILFLFSVHDSFGDNNISPSTTSLPEIVKNANVSFVNKNYIFYISDNQIYRINRDGSNKLWVPHYSEGEIISLSVVDDWVYYTEVIGCDMTNHYRVKIGESLTNAPNNGLHPKTNPLIITSSSILLNSTIWGVRGSGIGEWIKFSNTYIKKNGEKSKAVESLSGIALITGNIESKKSYYSNNRPKKIKIEFSNGKSKIIHLKDTYFDYSSPDAEQAFGGDGFMPDYQVFFFDNRKVDTTFVKITILDIYKGRTTNNTYIWNIKVL